MVNVIKLFIRTTYILEVVSLAIWTLV